MNLCAVRKRRTWRKMIMHAHYVFLIQNHKYAVFHYYVGLICQSRGSKNYLGFMHNYGRASKMTLKAGLFVVLAVSMALQYQYGCTYSFQGVHMI